jgi:hypothetical protein
MRILASAFFGLALAFSAVARRERQFVDYRTLPQGPTGLHDKTDFRFRACLQKPSVRRRRYEKNLSDNPIAAVERAASVGRRFIARFRSAGSPG